MSERPIRMLTGAFAIEVNTFAPCPTGLSEFEAKLYHHGPAATAERGSVYWTGPAQMWLERGAALGWECHETIYAAAGAGGPLTRGAYETIADTILNDVKAAMPLDVVILALHGSAVADGYIDCEGDLLRRVRDIVGPDTVIGVQLDSHCHLTQAMLDASTAIVIFKTYPHADPLPRAAELFDICAGASAGRVRPVMAMVRCPVLGLFPTNREPMAGLMRDISALEGSNGILSVSLAHGFPWADLPITGAASLVVADTDPAIAEKTAADVAERFLDIAPEAGLRFEVMEKALDRVAKESHFPILLSDVSDQAGGGAPSDSTYLIRDLLERSMLPACVGPLRDPIALESCRQAGVGATIDLRVGGKTNRYSGTPLDLRVVVRSLDANGKQFGLTGDTVNIGPVAVVETENGLSIVITERRVGIYTPSFFTNQNVALENMRFIVVKGLYRHVDTFADACREIVLVAAPGLCNPDWPSLGFKNLTRPIWPLDSIAGVLAN